MSRLLSDLDPSFRVLAGELLDRCAAEKIDLRVICTRRTHEEHLANLAAGTSWVKRSKHEDGLAIDVCPEQLLAEKGWAPGNVLWQCVGLIGEGLGLRWGGRWKHRDMGHFEKAKES